MKKKRAIKTNEKYWASRMDFPSTVDSDMFHWKFIFYCSRTIGIVSHVNSQAEAHINFWLLFTEKSAQDAAFAMLHEVGHAFGLADTYRSGSGEGGGQPMSVMSYNLFHNKDGNLILGRDDAVGIVKLYQRRHNKDIALPEDYSSFFGLPIYPSVFEVSQAYYHYIYHGNAGLIADLKDAFKQQYVYSRQGLNQLDNKGYAALHYFVDFGRLLLKRQTPEDVHKNWLAGFKAVLHEEKIDVNIQTKPQGNTPLHLATMRGYIPALKELLAHEKIDKSIVNAKGKTALDYATEKGFQDVIALLQGK